MSDWGSVIKYLNIILRQMYTDDHHYFMSVISSSWINSLCNHWCVVKHDSQTMEFLKGHDPGNLASYVG